MRTFRYGQKALTFAVTHPLPHQNISTEIHRSGGPFTLVPLPDRDGLPSSAVVWMERGPEVARLMALDAPEFEAAANARSCQILGPLTLAGRRLVWPMIAQIADRMAGERLALMAEAAHVVPPIGAQGLNMSLADLAALLDLAQTHDLGSAADAGRLSPPPPPRGAGAGAGHRCPEPRLDAGSAAPARRPRRGAECALFPRPRCARR